MSKLIAIYLPSLAGGGAEKVMLALASGFSARGFEVDLVLANASGPHLSQVDRAVSVVDLKASRVLTSVPGLARYLRRRRPVALVAALNHANVVAMMAKRLAGTGTRIIVSHHNNLSWSLRQLPRGRRFLLYRLMRHFYRRADASVAVSRGVAREVATMLGLPEQDVTTIYNPIVSAELGRLARQPPTHRWFAEGQPPVILGVGRLAPQKDFPTLIRAFAALRRKRIANLVILGEGPERAGLMALVRSLGLEQSVDMPGFVDHPYPMMRQASLFVLSSVAEGFSTALVEAMACGAPVVSTNCSYGPAEILEDGKWGRLVPVGDASALAEAMNSTLDEAEHPNVSSRAGDFTADAAVEAYLSLMVR